MYFLSAHRTIKAGNYFSSLFPAAHWLPGPHVIVFTQKYGADQCAGAFFPGFFFSFSHPLLSADPRDLRFPGGPQLWTQGPAAPSGQLASQHRSPCPCPPISRWPPPPPPGGFLNGVPMPVPEARVPGPSGLSWALEPRRGGEAGRGRWRNYFLT